MAIAQASPDSVSRPASDTGESRLRLQTIVRLRWFAVAGQLIAVAFVALVLRFPLPVGYCLVFITCSAWLNVYLRIRHPARHRLETGFATGLLVYDLLQLAALLFLTGGIVNPFIVLLVAPVTVSAATLPSRNTVLLGVIAVAAAAMLTFVSMPLPWDSGSELAGALHVPLLYKLGILAALVSCLVFLALYAGRISREGRQMAAALSATELILAHEQKLHALDGLAAAAAHELGTPLATIVLVAKELEREMPPESPHGEDIQLLRSQAQRCREILQKLTRSPSEQDPLHASLSVSQLIDEAVEPHRIGPKKVTVDASPALLQQSDSEGALEPVGERRPGVTYGLGNIIDNAVDFAKSKVEITARWSERDVAITVNDDGPGFSAEILERMGEPFVTSRPARGGRPRDGRGGLGLGFFIAKTLLERSGASITFGNRSGDESGAMVRIVWPRSAFELQSTTWPGAQAGRRG